MQEALLRWMVGKLAQWWGNLAFFTTNSCWKWRYIRVKLVQRHFINSDGLYLNFSLQPHASGSSLGLESEEEPLLEAADSSPTMLELRAEPRDALPAYRWAASPVLLGGTPTACPPAVSLQSRAAASPRGTRWHCQPSNRAEPG